MPELFKVEANGQTWYYNLDQVIRVSTLTHVGGQPEVHVTTLPITGEAQTLRVVGDEARRLEELMRRRYEQGHRPS